MTDPETGLHVPILACTLHPQTGALLPVGGTHIDAVTGLPSPIEVGSLMVDPNSGQPVPILAVTLDQETGNKRYWFFTQQLQNSKYVLYRHIIPTILEGSYFDLRYVRLRDIDIPVEKWLNYLQTDSAASDLGLHYLLFNLCPAEGGIYRAFANGVDPDQLASEEASCSGSALFAIKNLNL